MNPIFAYAAEYQYREIAAGRVPKTIRLTKEQIDYCREWLKEHGIPLYPNPQSATPSIMGMEIIEV